MKRMKLPAPNPILVYGECASEVSDVALRQKYANHVPNIEAANANYGAASAAFQWCLLPRAPHGQDDFVVTGTLTKKELTDLYSTRMVASKGAARKRYDDLLVSAEKCPFCGELGIVNTLDHYLPKANFPLYSVLPANLVPCCRDCNTGKSNVFPLSITGQGIHPYFDKQQFFDQRWIVATILPQTPRIVVFQATPPVAWHPTDRERSASHFNGYDLAKRYSVEAAIELELLIDQRKNSLRTLTPDSYRGYLLDVAHNDKLPLNGWKRTMYTGLAGIPWFSTADFNILYQG
jgi:hypothetical protein